jgi:hypothetical protein
VTIDALWATADWLIEHGPHLPLAEGMPDDNGEAAAAFLSAHVAEGGHECAMCADGTPATAAAATQANDLYLARRWLDVCQGHYQALMALGMARNASVITEAQMVARWQAHIRGK